MANFLSKSPAKRQALGHRKSAGRLLATLSALLFLSLPLNAQTEASADGLVTRKTGGQTGGQAEPSAGAEQGKKKKSKNVKLDFSEEMVEGNSDKPYELMLLKRPDQKFKKILKFRDDFHNNMESSFDDVR